ncbi:MAG: hypothetical protein QXO95_04030 [Candidatus Aenigmatarchaeota archaeon]
MNGEITISKRKYKLYKAFTILWWILLFAFGLFSIYVYVRTYDIAKEICPEWYACCFNKNLNLTLIENINLTQSKT